MIRTVQVATFHLVLFAGALEAQTLIRLDGQLGPFSGARFGEDVALVGDLDGDGLADWMAGRRGSQAGSHHAELRVYSGASGALLYDIPGPGGLNQLFLETLVDLADLDGDGVDEFGFSNANAVIGGLANVGEVTVYSGASGARLYRTEGVLFFGGFGASVAALGDVTADGVPDFVVGQLGTLNENAWVVSGIDGALVFNVAGPSGLGDIEFGYSCAGMGDLDGDGLDDFAVGTHSGDRVLFYSGATGALLRTVFGGQSFGQELAAVGDIDGDGLGELLIGAPAINQAWLVAGSDGSTLWRFAPKDGVRCGTSVAAAGDVDGDGTPDLLLGDDGFDNQRGRLQLYSGRLGRLIVQVEGRQPSDRLGRSCSGGRDLDGDGRPDFIIGAPFADGLRPDVGIVSLWAVH